MSARRRPDTVWQKDTNGVFLTNNDHLYTTDVLTSALNGNKSWAGIRESFGKTIVSPNAGTEYLMRFPGQWEDLKILHTYNMFRHYSPEYGRYYSADPLGFIFGESIFSYVNGKPIVRFDNFGLKCNSCGCWNTVAEKAAADSGNWSAYYSLACNARDPYACRAGDVAAKRGERWLGDLSRLTNDKLEVAIILSTDLETFGPQLEKYVQGVMEAIRIGLARARANQLVGADETHPRKVTRSSVSQFHHRVFESNGVSGSEFGGDSWDLIQGHKLTSYDWCPAPACYK